MLQWKRILCMLLAVVMMFTSAPMADLAYAEEVSEEMTSEVIEVVDEEVSLFAATSVVSPEVNGNQVTFRYSNASAKSVSLRGSMNGWNETAMTKGTDGVWTLTMELAAGTYEYKFFVNGSSWIQDPKNSTRIGDNSAFTVGNIVSPEVKGNEVTFRYSAPSATSVSLRGDMNGWGETAMTKGTDGVWSITLTLDNGEYGYKFYVNGKEWLRDPNNSAITGDNSLVKVNAVAEPEVALYDVTLHVYNKDGWDKLGFYAWEHESFSAFSTWPGKEIVAKAADDTWYDYTIEDVKAGKVNVIVNNMGNGKQTTDLSFTVAENATEFWIVTGDKNTSDQGAVYTEEPVIAEPQFVSPEVNGNEVTFRYYAPKATSVTLRGDMNGWSDTVMTKGANGVWAVTLTLDKGDYGYKFFVDGKWLRDPKNNAVTGDNSLVKVEKTIEPEKPVTTEVTFTYTNKSATSVKLAGTMTSWGDGAIAMTKDANGVWSVTVALENGVYQYKLIVNGNWINDPANTNGIYGNDNNNIIGVGTELSTKAEPGKVTFRYYAPNAKNVGLIGQMTGWTSVDMTKDAYGVWSITRELEAGSYQYKFMEDGNWVNDRSNHGAKGENNNDIIEVEAPKVVVSPEVNGKEVTFRYQAAGATNVYLAGSMNNWSGDATPMKKDADGVFAVTLTLAPGSYQYKFVVDGNWVTDQLNQNTADDGYGGLNSAVAVAGLADATANVTKGDEAELPATLAYFDAQGKESAEKVTYTVADSTLAKFVTINGNKITVAKDFTGEELVLTAKASNGATAVVTVKVLEKVYTYTIYAYSENADRMNKDAAALWFWDNATGGEGVEYLFDGTEKLSDGKNWLKAEIKVGFAEEIGIIFKSKGGWTWQTDDLVFENTDKTDCTLYIVEGKKDIYTSLDDYYNAPEEEVRYLIVEYTRDDKNYTDTNVYTWANGFAENTTGYPFEYVNGEYIAKVPVAASATDMNVGFIVRKGTNWDVAVKDGGDNYVTFPANQKVVKVEFHGEKVTNEFPGNKGSEISREDNAVVFYFRDDEAFLNNTLETLKGKVQVVVKAVSKSAFSFFGLGNGISGTYTMEYDEANARFVCNVPLIEDTDYYYYFLVDGVKVMDAFNAKTGMTDGEEFSMIRNVTYAVDMTAGIKNASMDYNDNNLLTVDWKAKEGESLEGFVVKELYADLGELGLGKVAIDPELKAVSIACDDSVVAGTKTIPVVLVDDCDAEYKATVEVTVTERTKTANTEEKLGDFDWDEAVIYFTVTDRFYDGNTSNNTLVDANDTTDGSRYHGGDLAGLTEKIDYLYDLGINTIWLTPIVDNVDLNTREGATDGQESYGYHGYWASDFTKLNPHLGTEEELEALVKAAHAKGMKVMVDVVLNHAGYGAEEHFNTIISDGNGGYIDMIRGKDNTVKGDDKLDSLSGLPDFVTENEAVRNQLIEWQTDWVEKYNIDYFRVDTVKHVDSTTWAAFKNALTEINPEFKLIGEYYGANYTNATAQLNSGKMDALLDFGFKDYAKRLALGEISAVEAILAERNGVLSNTATFGSFLGSHDEQGLLYTFMNECGKPADWAEALMKVASTLQITAKGQPVIYYGEEIGLSGANNYPVQDNRYDFDWDKMAAQDKDVNSLYNHYKTMLNIRRDYSEVFAKGERAVVQMSDAEGYEIIRRSYEGTNVYVGMNVWGDDRTTTVYVTGEAGSVYTDLYSGKTYTVAEDGTITITIPRANDGGTAVLVLTEGKENEIVDTNKVTVKLHYSRPDKNYTGWNAWLWSDGMGGAAYDFVNENGEMVATITVDGRSEMKVNYIIRKGNWEAKDVDADQSIDISDIVSGTVHFYVTSGVAGGTRILGADAIKGSKIVSSMYDRETNKITIETSTPVVGELKDAFEIICTDGTKIDITKITRDNCTYTVSIKQDLSAMKEVLKSYTICYEGFEYRLGMPNIYSSEEFESQYTYSGDDLGATWTKTATTFKVWAPTADAVKVALYKSGTEGTEDLIKTCDMTLGEAGVWTGTVSGDLNGTYYTYLVTVNGKTEEACDPYARTTGVNGKRAMVLNLDATDPKGWSSDVSPNKGMEYTDAIIYELHVRDASIDESSGVSDANKGKFLGLTETGTKTEGGVSTVLDHISDLGVTHVHLLPVYDFGSVDESKLDEPQFNWGYDPVNYNVPEGSYSTNPYDGATRVKEMKEMVMALHENNVNVVMDVVYNHVYDAGSFCFNEIVPNYFSRVNADGSFSNGSGCGNDTASERAMVQKYIVDSVMYWAEEYHIDGFRFDLVGLLDAETMNKVIDTVHEKYPDVIFYGEGWTMGTSVTKENVTMATQQNAKATPNLAYFSDTIRDLIAGRDLNAEGFVNGGTGKESDMANCFKATTSWCPSPTQTVNYASCHDNYTLMDKINGAYASASEEDKVKMNNLSASLYMLAQGIPFIHAGEEFLRTKIDENGEVIHNSYKSSDYVNALRWDNMEDEKYADVVDYYAGLIEFRKNHEALRLTEKSEVAANVKYHKVASDVLLYDIAGNDAVEGEVSDGIIVIYNASKADKSISLYNYGIEEGEWKVCIDADDAGIEVLDTITDGKVTVEAISTMVLVKGETEDTDSVYIDNYREPSVDDEDDTTGNSGNTDRPVVTPNAPTVDAETEDTTVESAPVVVRPATQETVEADDEEADVEIEDEETPLAAAAVITVEVKGEENWTEVTKAVEEAVADAIAKVESAEEASDVVVEITLTKETTVVPDALFEAIAGQNVVVEFKLENGVTWSINGASVTGNVSNLNLDVEVGGGEIPEEVMTKVATENSVVVKVSLAYSGEFGCEAVMNIPVGNENAGKYANLYYFNPETNEMEFIASALVKEDGTADLPFTHASDYAIVINDVNVAELEADEVPLSGGSDSVNVVPVVVMLIALTAMVYVGVLLVKKGTIKFPR